MHQQQHQKVLDYTLMFNKKSYDCMQILLFYMKTDKYLMQPVCRAAAANVWEASLQPARRQVNTELNHNQLTSMYTQNCCAQAVSL